MTDNENKTNRTQSNISSDNCPHIGIKGESGSFFGYASPSNCCFKVENPGRIKSSYQEQFCLTPDYQECEVFESPVLVALPPGIQREPGGIDPLGEKLWVRLGIAAALALVITMVFLYLIFQRPLYGREEAVTGLITQEQSVPTAGELVAASSSSPTMTLTGENEDFVLGLLKEGTPSPSLTPSNTPIPTTSPTITSTFTPEITPGPGFETPFGPNASYLIHVVVEGENYPKIAQNYDTSVEVLKVSNIIPQGMGLRAGLIIVVLPGTKDPAGLPGFVAVLVDKPMTVQELANVYQSNPEDIQKYNQVDPTKPVPVGRWIIIPYPL